MKPIRVLILSCFFAMTAGCATGEKTEATMKSWLNHNVNELVASWGPPESSVQLPGGNVIYTWTSGGSWTSPTRTTTTASVTGAGNTVFGNAQTTTTGGHTFNFVCQMSFTVSETGQIVSYNWQGNDCY